MKKLTRLNYLNVTGNYLDCREYTVKKGWPAIFEESCDQDEQLYKIEKPDKSWILIVVLVVVGIVVVALIGIGVFIAVLKIKKNLKNRPKKDKAKKPLIKKHKPAEDIEEIPLEKEEKPKKEEPARLFVISSPRKEKETEKIQAGEPIGRALCRRAPPRMDCESLTEEDFNLCVLAGFTGLYDSLYQRPRIHDAGIEAGLRADQAVRISKTCSDHAQKYVAGHTLPGYLKEEDVEGIALYTFEFDRDKENNPERLINRALFTRKFDRISKVRSLMYVTLSSMRKLPLYKGRMLFRGIRECNKPDLSQYYEGNTVSWPEITTTTKNIEVVKAFLTESYNRPPGKAKNLCPTPKGVIFIIDNGWGYDIQEYSLTPEYEEVVIEPDRRFVVKSVMPGDVTMIYLEMVDTPVALDSKMPLTFSDDISGMTITLPGEEKSRKKSDHNSSSSTKKKSSKSKKKHESVDDTDDGYERSNDNSDYDSEESGLIRPSTKKHSTSKHGKKHSGIVEEKEDEDKKKKGKKKDKGKEKSKGKDKGKEKGKEEKEEKGGKLSKFRRKKK